MSWQARLRSVPRRLGLWDQLTAPVVAVAALVAAAWAALATGFVPMPTAMASGGGAPVAVGPLWICNLAGGMSMGGPAAGGGPVSQAVAGMPMWSLMALAMMLPAALPATSHVAVNSLRRRRGRAVSEFLIGYLALWLAFGAVVLLGLALLPFDRAVVPLAAALGVATAWELSPAKQWALQRCHRSSPLPPSGWRANLGATRFGVVHGSACVASCWPLMLVMAVAPSARLAWCTALTGVGLAEKLTLKPRRRARRLGMLLGVAFVLAAVAVGLGL
jgi:predicted metal-binding membrane protein